jgi:hypothetical protein
VVSSVHGSGNAAPLGPVADATGAELLEVLLLDELAALVLEELQAVTSAMVPATRAS